MTDITAAMNHEFSKSKQFRLAMLILQGAIAFGALKAVGESDKWLSAYGVVALTTGAISLWLKQLSVHSYQCAERYRRLLYFSKSNDDPIPAHEVAIILAEYEEGDRTSQLREDQYYDSEGKIGDVRSLENLQESSFYTRKLSDSSASFFRAVTVIGLSAAVLYLLWTLWTLSFGAPNQDPKSFMRAAEISSKLIAFTMLGTYFDLWSAFAQLARTSDAVFHECSRMLQSDCVEEKETRKLVSKYDCALASAVPIPTLAWMLHRSALEKGWTAIKLERSQRTPNS